MQIYISADVERHYCHDQEVKLAYIYQTCIPLKSRMIFVCSGCTQSIGTTWHYQASRTSLMSHLVINLPQIGAALYEH